MSHKGRWSLVGVDMTGIELRMLAHFMYPYDGGEYAKLVLEGDVHQANADAWGVPRPRGKTGIYGMIYGCGDPKLGRTLFPDAPERQWKRLGTEARAAIMGKFPALSKLTEAVKLAAATRGYLIGLDGRRLPVRSEHSALNTVLQSAAAVCSKVWIITGAADLTWKYGPQGWERPMTAAEEADFMLRGTVPTSAMRLGTWAAMMWVHDEVQVAAQTPIAEDVGERLVRSIEVAGEILKLNVPITGEMKVGKTWADTH